MSKRINVQYELPTHECQSWQEGDWLVFQCPHCAFMRKLNWRSNKMVTLNQGKPGTLHKGMHSPVSKKLARQPAFN